MSGVTLKARVTWVLSKTAFAPSVLRLWIKLVNARFYGVYGLVHEIIHRWKSVVSKGFVPAFSFAERGPSKQGGFAALFGWTRIKERPTVFWRVHRRFDAPRPLGKGVMLSPDGWANSCGVTCPVLLASM